jgi:hypothetical protein
VSVYYEVRMEFLHIVCNTVVRRSPVLPVTGQPNRSKGKCRLAIHISDMMPNIWCLIMTKKDFSDNVLDSTEILQRCAEK